MKKFCALAVICALAFALVLTACDNGNTSDNGNGNGDGGVKSNTTLQIKNQSSKELGEVVFQGVQFIRENADIIGTWAGVGQGFAGEQLLILLDIADNAWVGSIEPQFGQTLTGQGKWTRNGNSFTFSNKTGGYGSLPDDIAKGTATLSGDILTANFEVRMSPTPFTLISNNLQTTIKSGNNVTKTVEEGSGYIFFTINYVDHYTKEVVTVEKNSKTVFTFTNSTLVVESANPDETKTLGSL